MPNNVIIEFLALPPDLNIETILSVPESVGRFQDPRIKREKILTIAQAIQSSSVFVLSNTSESAVVTCLALLGIFEELDLIVKSVSNIKRSTTSYKDLLKSGRFSNGGRMYNDDEDEVENTSDSIVIIVNLFPLISEDLISKALTSIENLNKFQSEVEESIKMATS